MGQGEGIVWIMTRAAWLRNEGDVTWLAALRRYATFIIVANLVWEIAHVPLYTIWQNGSPGEIAFAVVHCTGGDIVIASLSLLAALLVLGNARWPNERFISVAAFALVFGLAYTMFSEWLNVTVRRSWTYSDLMPTVPIVGLGLSPLAQWIVVPLAAFWWACRSSTMRTQPIRSLT